MEKIIRLKHWQVFGIVAIGYIISYILQSSNFEIWGIPSLVFAAISTIITLILIFSWIMVIGLFLNNKEENTHYFRNWVFILSVCSCVVGYSLLNLERLNIDTALLPFWTGFFTTFTFWGIGYTFFHAAKSLKSLELGREAEFSEYIIDAIMLFAFPIGVWFIQPRINRILAKFVAI